MRHLIIPALLLAACTQDADTARADFGHWIQPDGSVQWRLVVGPAAWQRLAGGERLDLHHQSVSGVTIRAVVQLIDANLRRAHLCPGSWTMSEVRRSAGGSLSFAGVCGTTAGLPGVRQFVEFASLGV